MNWRLSSRAGAVLILAILVGEPTVGAQQRMGETVIRLPYGVRLVLPAGWRADREPLATALANGVAFVDARALGPKSDGYLVTFASPADASEVVTLSVAEFAGGLDQRAVTEMDSSRVAQLGEEEFHGELARVTALAGNTLIRWDGLAKRTIAGMTALEMTYHFRTPSSPELVSRTLLFCRGGRSFRLQFVRAQTASSGVRDVIQRVLSSLEVDH